MFNIKRNDRAPSITCRLGSGALNLTGTTVKFIMRDASSPSATPKVNAAATIVSATEGIVRYSWASGDTNTAGLYLAEWEVTFAGDVKGTYPRTGHLYVNVIPDLG